jgi:hypothetical protein
MRSAKMPDTDTCSLVIDGDRFLVNGQEATRADLVALRDQIEARMAPPRRSPQPVWKIVKLAGGKIAVDCPWNRLVIDECHRLMGKWEVVRDLGRMWVLAGEHEETIRAFLADLYDGPRVERIITFASELARESPLIDGTWVIGDFNRVRRGRVEHRDVVEVLDDAVEAGGSKNHPILFGRLKVRARVRPNALITWEGGTVVVEEVPQQEA